MFERRLETVLADCPCSLGQIELRPRRLRHLAMAGAGEEQHLPDRSVGIGESVAGAYEDADFLIRQNPHARALLADEGLRLQPIGRRQCDSVDLALDCPAEHALDYG